VGPDRWELKIIGNILVLIMTSTGPKRERSIHKQMPGPNSYRLKNSQKYDHPSRE